MLTRSHTAASKSSVLFLALTVGLATWLATSGSGLAVPKQGQSCDATGKDKGLNACADSPGHIIVCAPSGDYMCCKITPTGKDCEQIENDSENSALGKVRQLPRGQLQVAPTTPVPKTSPLQRGGTIQRRGVEGEQPAPAEPEVGKAK
jgi:hypothetical protein